MKPTPAQTKILQSLRDGETIRRILIIRTGNSFFYWLPTTRSPRYQLRHKTIDILLANNWIEFYDDERHGWTLLRITDIGRSVLNG